MTVDLESTSLTERIVLLGVVERAATDGEPVGTVEVRDRCLDHLGAVETDVLGTPSEADVMRALRALAAGDALVEVEPDDRSPVGKGRPSYALDAESAAILSALDSDERLTPIVDRVNRRLATE